MPNLITLRPLPQEGCSHERAPRSYNNTPQVNQITLRLPQPGEPNDPADFKVKSPVDVKEIRDYMAQMIFKIEILFGNGLSESSTPSMISSFIHTQPLKLITMPLKRDWPIIRRHGAFGRCR